MTWWLRSRGATAIAAVIALQTGVCSLLGGVLVPSPSLAAGGMLSVPLRVIAPLALSTVTLLAFAHVMQLERAAVRRLTLMDAGVLAVAALVSLLLGSLAYAVDFPDALPAARNAAAYIGLGASAALVAGPTVGAATPAAYVILAALLSDGRGDAAWLRWSMEPAASKSAAAIAATLMLIGLAGTARFGGARMSAAEPRGSAA